MDQQVIALFNNLATSLRNVSVAVGTFAFMWSALQYATAAGSPHQMEAGKMGMKASAIGVGAVVLASAIVNIVFSALSAAPPAAGG